MPTINIVYPESSRDIADVISVIGINRDAVERAIENEKEDAELRSQKRKEIFSNIVRSTSSNSVPYKHAFYAFLGILTSITATSFFTLIPAHNVIEDPSYWFEFIILFCCPFLIVLAVGTKHDFFWCTNLKLFMKTRFIIELWIAMVTISVIAFGAITFVWVYILGYQNPVPFQGYLLFFCALAGSLMTIWYRLPQEWRDKKHIRKRFLFYLIHLLYASISTSVYASFTTIFLTIPSEFQWVFAMCLPLVKELNIAVFIYINMFTSDGDYDGGSIYNNFYMMVDHTAFLAFTVGSTATSITSIVIIIEDFITNILISLYLIHLARQDETSANLEKMIKLLYTIILNEWVETVIPLGYLICLLMGYYGPNSEIIGDVGCSYWHYNAIEDIVHTINFLSTFFLVDILSLFVSNFLLSKFAGIQMYQGFAELEKEFGKAFAAKITIAITGKFGLNFIASAIDNTGSFDWIDGNFSYSESMSAAPNNMN